MSLACRLRGNSHGEDGKKAADLIQSLREENAILKNTINDRDQMIVQIREAARNWKRRCYKAQIELETLCLAYDQLEKQIAALNEQEQKKEI